MSDSKMSDYTFKKVKVFLWCLAKKYNKVIFEVIVFGKRFPRTITSKITLLTHPNLIGGQCGPYSCFSRVTSTFLLK